MTAVTNSITPRDGPLVTSDCRGYHLDYSSLSVIRFVASIVLVALFHSTLLTFVGSRPFTLILCVFDHRERRLLIKQTKWRQFGSYTKTRILWNKELTLVKNVTMIWFIYDLLHTAVLTLRTCYNQTTLGSPTKSSAGFSNNLNF